jgi:hypothetical protein
LYIGTILLLNTPYVQQRVSIFVAKELSSALKTQLTIDKIDLGVLNRIIVDNLKLYDQSNKEMLRVTRLSAKFDILALLKKKIVINNVQLFGFNASLNKKTSKNKTNYQFIIDALASKDTTKKENNLNIRINSLLLRRGKISYDVLSEKETPEKLNMHHIHLRNIVANISLKALQKDSINASIKKLSIEETQSGIELKKLSLKIIANSRNMRIENFAINLPNTTLMMDTIRMSYDSLSDFNKFADNVHFSCRIMPSEVALCDFSSLIPALAPFKKKLKVEANVHGTINQLECPLISITFQNHFHLKGNLSLQDMSQPQDAFIFGKLSNLYADQDGLFLISQSLGQNNKETSSLIKRIGNLSFHGEISGYFTELVTYGIIDTNMGSIRADVKLSSNKQEKALTYSGSIKTKDFELGRIIANSKVGKVTFNLDVKGRHLPNQYPSITLKGIVSSIDYSKYTYKDITLDGEYKQGGFDGQIALNDRNGSILLNGQINTVGHIPSFDFRAIIHKVRPHNLLLTSKYENTEISFQINANFTGSSINDMKGEINIDSLSYISPEKDYSFNNLKITAFQSNNQSRQLTINSNFLKASISGEYSYKTLPSSIMGILKRYLPAVVMPNSKVENNKNNFQFSINIINTEILSRVFDIPLEIYTPSSIKGYVNDKAHRLRIEGYFPRFRYKNNFFESAMILCENSNDLFHLRMRLNDRKSDGNINIAVEGYAKNDSIQTSLSWGNSGNTTYSGKLAGITHFIKEQKSKDTFQNTTLSSPNTNLKTIINIQKTNIILNDTLWNIQPSQIMISSNKIHINNFNFNHEDRHLNINGTISDQPEDTVRLDLKDINIGYIFDIADIGVHFEGEATGPAYACGLLKKPVMYTNLFIKNLGINNGLLGDANIYGEWHNNIRGIYLDAHIKEKEIAKSHVYGYIYPLKPQSALDLQIEADKTNLKFLEYYMNSITPQFNGRASGHVHFYGKFKELTLEGRVLGDASMKVEVLNTTFFLKDSIQISPEGLYFQNNRIYDPQGNQGKVNGYLHYEHFKKLEYRFQFDYNNVLIMNTQENHDYPFYGTVYGTGNALIEGNYRDGVNINVALTTNHNTNFVYMKESVASAANNQFIQFVDKTPRRIIQDSAKLVSDYELARQVSQQEDKYTDIHLNLLVDATPDATMKIIMDPMAGDYISGKGSGNIRTEFYNKGDLKMLGSYQINQGIYKFSLQEVIRKDFSIKNGSSITFNGSPYDATLDIKASYPVNSVSLNDLMPNASDYVNQTNIKVNCIMNLTGALTSPDIKLGIELPNERDEVQALIRNYIPTDEQMNMQILYLLGIGKFYTPENVNTTQNSNMMSSMLSSTLSGQFNNALSNIIDNNNWNIGTNLSTGQKGWTDVEFEGMLSGQLLNNRLLINGNFGYRDNPIANSNFIGDFEAEWLINRSGDIRLKAYSETNDRYYTKTNLTTQGIGIIFKKDFNTWKELIFWNKWRVKRLKHKEKPSITKDTKTDQQPARVKAKRKDSVSPILE